MQGGDARARVSSASTVDALYGPSIVHPRFMALMMSLFAGLALVTAGIGLYGALAYAVATRIEEIGVRVALGATTLNLLRLVAREVVLPVVVGMVLGLIVSQWGARAIASRLYHVSPTDPVSLAVVMAVLLVTAAVAAAAPGLRAVRVDPAVVLRSQ